MCKTRSRETTEWVAGYLGRKKKMWMGGRKGGREKERGRGGIARDRREV